MPPFLTEVYDRSLFFLELKTIILQEGILLKRDLSFELFQISQRLIPGGVNSPVRAFRSVDDFPSFIKKGEGSKLWDVDGNEYIDYVGSWGAAILGHAHPEVVKAIYETAQNGLSFGAPTEGENRLVSTLLSAFPAMDQFRLVSSGTEACMSAIRLARAHTKRDKFIKFTGNYHGHADALLVSGGSGLATFQIPSSGGVTQKAVDDTLLAPFNNLQAVKDHFQKNPKQIAAIIVEPIACNVGFIRPQTGFLEGLRELCSEEGALLIFDEVITGFRLCWGGAQTLFKISPDITTLGKIIGGGLPLAAFGAKAEIMANLAPLGPVYQAGTLSGNPVAVSCGLKTLEILQSTETYDKLAKSTDKLVRGIREIAAETKQSLQIDHEGSVFGFFFTKEPVNTFEDTSKTDNVRFKAFFKSILNQGLYWAPSAFEAGFLSLAHSNEDILKTLQVISQAFRELK